MYGQDIYWIQDWKRRKANRCTYTIYDRQTWFYLSADWRVQRLANGRVRDRI